jgi:hypothetical protein
MITQNQSDGMGDARLGEILRQSRPDAQLPPGFQDAVWRKISRARVSRTPGTLAERLDQLAGWLLRPRLALALAVVMVAGGVTAGIAQGEGAANSIARAKYLASVDPSALRP